MIKQALVCGEPVLIENLPEKIDPVLEPLLARRTIKKGRLVLKRFLGKVKNIKKNNINLFSLSVFMHKSICLQFFAAFLWH